MSIGNEHRTYLYQIDDEGMVVWYGGLGTPWKIIDDPSMAVSVSKGQVEYVLKGLNTFAGKEWSTINGSIHNEPHNFHCQCCGTSWTDNEAYHVEWWAAHIDMIPEKDLPMNSDMFLHHDSSKSVPISSLLRSREFYRVFRNAIFFSTNCKVCEDLLCGDCPPTKKGRNAGRCNRCKTKSWEK